MISDNFSTLEKKLTDGEFDSIVSAQEKYWSKIRHPFIGGFELTPFCNLRCVHCYLQDSKKEKLLSTEEVKFIIDKLHKKGVLVLYFTGGEILTRSDFPEIYLYAKKKGFIIELLTNATLINQEIIDIFNEYPPATVSISMYGKDEETYRKVTRTEGNFEKFLNGITLLRQNDIHCEIKFIALKQNFHEFYEIEKFAKELGTDFSFTFELFPTLNGDTCVLNNMLDIDDIVAFETNYEKSRRVWSANIKCENPYMEMDKNNMPLFSCNIASTLLLVDYKGYVNPCNKLRLQTFNLLTAELDEAWSSFQEYTKMLASPNYKCASCKNIYICSPCPAINFLANGDYSTPSEKFCELTQKRFLEFSKPKYNMYRAEYQNKKIE